MDNPVLRFDTFGTVAYVLRDVEINVPLIFTYDPEPLIEAVRNVVNSYSAQNGWDVVALSLSKGLARHDLDDMIKNEVRHHGPIVIDPTGSTPEHQEFQHCSEVRSCRERLVMANELTGDVMIILYGVDQADRYLIVDMLMRRLRMLEDGLNLLAENEAGVIYEEKQKNLVQPLCRRIALIINQLTGHDVDGGIEQELLNFYDQLGNRLRKVVSSAYEALLGADKNGLEPSVSQSLNAMTIGVGLIPENFSSLGISFEQNNNELRNNGSLPTPEHVAAAHLGGAVNHEHRPEAPTPEPA